LTGIFCTVGGTLVHSYGDITMAGDWGLQNLGLSSALRAFEQGGIFIMPHLLWHGASVSSVSSEGPPPFSRLLQHTGGCWGPILTWILMGHQGFRLYMVKNAWCIHSQKNVETVHCWNDYSTLSIVASCKLAGKASHCSESFCGVHYIVVIWAAVA
jgi:hypothetical protein